MAPALAIAGAAPKSVDGLVNVGIPGAWPGLSASQRWAVRTADPLDQITLTTSVKRDRAVFHEGEQAENVYEVTSGTIRVFKLLPDGRRQIVGFLESGDFLGLSFGETYLYSAEAVTPATLRRFPRHRLEALMDENPAVHRRLLGITANELLTDQDQMVL